MSRNGATDQRGNGRGTVETRKRRRMRPTLMALEDRRLLSTITIVANNPTDTPVAGQADLRQAIAQANTTGGDRTITFDKAVFKTPQTINLNGNQLELTDKTRTETITGPLTNCTVNGNNANGSVIGGDSGTYAYNSTLALLGTKVKGDKGTMCVASLDRPTESLSLN